MKAKHQVSSLGKLALLASVVSVCLLTASSFASPISPGFDLFTSDDALGNSLGAALPFVPSILADGGVSLKESIGTVVYE
ncbi:MAG: hypothetical protein IH898_12720 [Planctomycetes bacterium]|nr:hypothetical protein [Planctomycetota bacterium]